MTVIKTILFHLLMSLRGIILSISKLLAIAFFLAAILMIVIHTSHHMPLIAKITALTLGVFFTSINWFYDYLIFYFEPENIEVRLFR